MTDRRIAVIVAVAVLGPCACGKADRTPAQAGMKLRTTPRRPHYLPTIAVRGMGAAAIPEAWRPYWTGALEE